MRGSAVSITFMQSGQVNRDLEDLTPRWEIEREGTVGDPTGQRTVFGLCCRKMSVALVSVVRRTLRDTLEARNFTILQGAEIAQHTRLYYIP